MHSLTLCWTLIFTAAAAWHCTLALTVMEGSSVLLSCRYSVKHHGPTHVCWGRSCGTLWCNDILLQADASGVISKVSDRYRFAGNVLAGQVDLSILKVTEMDSGQYCCRVDIDGYFNDKKVTYTLKVEKGPVASTLSPVTTVRTTEPPAATNRWMGTKSPRFDGGKRNSSLAGRGIIEEELVPTLSLKIDIPVLSFSLSVLLLLLGCLAVVALKRKFQKRSSKPKSQEAAEPPHIIHEIQTRRPLEENIYTLD